jgi:hypothetical protein
VPGYGWMQNQQRIAEEAKRKKEMAALMPPAHRHAFELLCAKGVVVDLDAGAGAIIRVEPDAILFRSPKGPRTAWLRGTPTSGTKVCVEDGLPCEPASFVRASFGET